MMTVNGGHRPSAKRNQNLTLIGPMWTSSPINCFWLILT